MDLSHITLETNRLRLVPVSEQYLDEILLEFRLPVTRYMTYISAGSMEELIKRHKTWKQELQQGTKLFMAAVLKDSGEFVGCFALENIGQEKPEMGGWLKSSAHGHGYGREAVAAIKKWADEHVEYSYILWPCAKENIASRKLAETLGGVIHREFEKETADGRSWPELEYWFQKN